MAFAGVIVPVGGGFRPDFSSDWRFLPAEGLVCGVILPVGGKIRTLKGMQKQEAR